MRHETTDATTPRIQRLPEVVQNQIAAGEVVERPASVVKELVENALDAGATSVSVELEDGGHSLLRVTDDGRGMSDTDLALAVERHATSKIRQAEDIFRIETMGFRGEALPSIAAVSRFRLTSAERGAREGARIVIAGGRTERMEPTAPRPGTVVEVRDLFFNTPARRKFLKSPRAEVAAAGETLTRLALANPGVAFRLESDGRTSLALPAHASLAERIAALFGRELTGGLLPVRYDTGAGLRIEGFAARPPESRPNSRGIYLFLNRRWIRHPGLARVVADAYRGALPPRRYPFAVLVLTIDPARVDVNVHPTKEEVRFEEESRIVGSVRRAVEQAIRTGAETGAAPSPATAELDPTPEAATEDASRGGTPGGGAASAPAAPPSRDPRSAPRPALLSREGGRARSSAHAGDALAALSAREFAQAYAPGTGPAATQGTLATATASTHRILAQAGGKYLVVEAPDGLLLVDQHALHERWNYEKLGTRAEAVASQRLLLPVVVELPPAEAALLEEALPALDALGFEAEPFGLATLSVSAAPVIVPPTAVARIVREVVSDLGEPGRAVADLRERARASLACRTAVLFNRELPRGELEALLQRFHEADQPLTCPHGRPTTVRITWEELARRFGRS